jgi:hypothetical protein
MLIENVDWLGEPSEIGEAIRREHGIPHVGVKKLFEDLGVAGLANLRADVVDIGCGVAEVRGLVLGTLASWMFDLGLWCAAAGDQQ